MSTESADQRCPDCSRPLSQLSDYPANELWCLHCGNRYLAAVNPTDSETADRLFGFRILLLDTSNERRNRLVRNFTKLGYQVTPVCHHRQALEAASFRRFDVIVLPSTLSEIDCHAFIAKMKRLLGSVNFILVNDAQAEERIKVDDPETLCVTVDPSDYQRLEQAIEQIVDDAVASQRRTSRSNRPLVNSHS